MCRPVSEVKSNQLQSMYTFKFLNPPRAKLIKHAIQVQRALDISNWTKQIENFSRMAGKFPTM